MSAHVIKLACWSLWFWSDYLLIACCKLRGVGLAARRGLLAACLPTELAHKASKNNFIGNSPSEGEAGQNKSRQVNLFMPEHPRLCTGIRAPRQQNPAFGLLFTKHSHLQGLNTFLFLVSSKLSLLSITSALLLQHPCKQRYLPHKLDALSVLQGYGALL